MITLTREEAQQVLDALEECLGWTHSDLTEAAHETLRARLAQPEKEQEPVAKSPTHGMTLGERIKHVGGWETERGTIEFGSPMAVDALIKHVLRDTAPVAASDTSQERVAETEEKRHDPKPQAWMLITEQGVCGGIFRFRYDAEVGARELRERFSIVPLYYSELPRREWQWLTDDEVRLIRSAFHESLDTNAYVRAIEQKLKEKNT